jgi:hypothetical protein
MNSNSWSAAVASGRATGYQLIHPFLLLSRPFLSLVTHPPYKIAMLHQGKQVEGTKITKYLFLCWKHNYFLKLGGWVAKLEAHSRFETGHPS